MSDRLYKAVWVHDDTEEEETPDEYGVYPSDYADPEPRPDPEGWAEFCIGKWGEYRPFFFPATDRIYRSRSTAQRRVDAINRWGGHAVLAECTPIWETVADANARRAAARLQTRIAKKRAELAALETKAGL